jgi:dTDP-4-dehydrorhamnose 3,5-epimerase
MTIERLGLFGKNSSTKIKHTSHIIYILNTGEQNRMEFIETKIEGLYLIKPNILGDARGKFIKTFHLDTFKEKGLSGDFQESFYSTSQKNVLRGMHFQTPPYDHEKLVYVPCGSILDVVLDLRKNSPTYGKSVSQHLNSENGHLFYIPKGCAHGFLSLEDNTYVTYMQTSMYAPNNDEGVHYASFGFDWGVANPIVSERDQAFVSLADFDTPFQ